MNKMRCRTLLFGLALVLFASPLFAESDDAAAPVIEGDGGACCLPNGECVDVDSEAECVIGIFFPGLSCAFHPCPPPRGACCLPNGECENTTASECRLVKGNFQGPGTNCETSPCTGACCHRELCVDDVTEERCNSVDGIFYLGLTCEQVECAHDGACCHPNGDCKDLTRALCADEGGVFQGLGTKCETTKCPDLLEACCLSGGLCLEIPREACLERGGKPQGPDSKCEAGTCDPHGACCLVNGSCELLTEESCTAEGGAFRGRGTNCETNPCNPKRAGQRGVIHSGGEEASIDTPVPTVTLTESSWGRVKSIFR